MSNFEPLSVQPSVAKTSRDSKPSEVRSSSRNAGVASLPSVFEFTDYRTFLNAFYAAKRAANPAYSMSAFARRAGLGANSRGYLKLIIEGKRNLTAHTLRRFTDALGLGAKASLYFENLVYFNQAKTPQDRDYYFQRLTLAAGAERSSQFELLQSQYLYYSNWYLVPVRELVGLDGFREDPEWIASSLRGKITRKQAQEALAVLERLGMIVRESSTGRLRQAEPLVKYSGGVFRSSIQKFHIEMMERAKESLIDDPYEEREASCVTLACDGSRVPEMKKAIAEFRDRMNLEFGENSRENNAVIQLNVQIFQMTPIQSRPQKNKAKNQNNLPLTHQE